MLEAVDVRIDGSQFSFITTYIIQTIQQLCNIYSYIFINKEFVMVLFSLSGPYNLVIELTFAV